MTNYYAVNPLDPNDKIPLDSTNRKEAEEEMENMQNFLLTPEFPNTPYNHELIFMFNVSSYYTWEDVPIAEVRQGILKQITKMDSKLLKGNKEKWQEVLGIVNSSDLGFVVTEEANDILNSIDSKRLEENISNLQTLSELYPPPSEIGKSIREVWILLDQISNYLEEKEKNPP